MHPGHVLSHNRVQATMHNWGQVSLAMSTLGPEVKFVNAVTAGGSVKFFASGVNFSRNNAIYNINENTKYILY